MSDIPEMPYETIYHEKILQSATNVTRADAKEFIELATSIPIVTTITKCSLSDANRAIKDLKESKINGSLVFIP